MSESNVVLVSARAETETADWRPFNVWASQVRAAQSNPSAAAEATTEAPRETWDPYAVWKRQVRGS